jgi:hypothetical protein
LEANQTSLLTGDKANHRKSASSTTAHAERTALGIMDLGEETSTAITSGA